MDIKDLERSTMYIAFHTEIYCYNYGMLNMYAIDINLIIIISCKTYYYRKQSFEMISLIHLELLNIICSNIMYINVMCTQLY